MTKAFAHLHLRGLPEVSLVEEQPCLHQPLRSGVCCHHALHPSQSAVDIPDTVRFCKPNNPTRAIVQMNMGSHQ